MWTWTLASVNGHTLWGDLYDLAVRALERFFQDGWHQVAAGLAARTPVFTGVALALIGLAMMTTGHTTKWSAWAIMTFFGGTILKALLS